MNAPEKLLLPSSLDEDHTRGQAQALFPLESLQHLDVESSLRCQKILRHGWTFGIWETPESMIPHMQTSLRSVALRRRIVNYLPKEVPASPVLDELLDEGVLWLTRLALLMRMGPAGMGKAVKFKSLDASTVAGFLYAILPKLLARGVCRRLESTAHPSTGFASRLTAEDLRTWWADEYLGAALRRLTQLHGLGFWPDAPAAREFKGKTTAVHGTPTPRPPERKRIPYPAISDDYLAAMGPRVLWLIKDLGPNLIHLLETLTTMLESGNTAYYTINRRIVLYFQANVWRDRNGQEIKKPPFDLKHTGNSGKHNRNDPVQHDPFEWPPRHWSSVQALAVTIQGAHLWMALLVMAARIGEVATLGRDCVEFARDGQPYANGKTYKASRALGGKEREWPMPDIRRVSSWLSPHSCSQALFVDVLHVGCDGLVAFRVERHSADGRPVACGA